MVSVAALLAATAQAHAVEQTPPVFPGLTIGVPLGITPPPGIYFANTGIIVSGPRVDGSGNKSISRTTVGGDSSTLLISTPWTILGGTYSAYVTQGLFSTSVWANGAQPTPANGLYNTLVYPIDLGYKLTDHLSMRVSVGGFLPDGYFSPTFRHTANGYGTFQPSVAFTYLNNGIQFTSTNRIDFNFNDAATNYHTGNIFYSEATLTKSFGKFTVGPAGFILDQYGNDVHNGVVVPASPTNSYGNKEFLLDGGLYAAYDFGQFTLSGTILHDFIARNAGQNTFAFLRVSLPLGDPFGSTPPVAPTAIPDREGHVTTGDYGPMGRFVGPAPIPAGDEQRPILGKAFGTLGPDFSWAGLYLGGHFGYSYGVSKSTTYSAVTGVPVATRSGGNNNDMGGAHIGYMVSMPTFAGATPFAPDATSSVLVGIEADIDGMASGGAYPLLAGNITDSVQENVTGSVRGRLGYAMGRFLAYGTGGLAIGEVVNTYRAATGAFNAFDQTRLGYTVGGGFEYALSKSLLIRAEYRYTSFSSSRDVLRIPAAPALEVAHKDTSSRVLLGFSYKFNKPAPAVVARY